MSFQALIFDLDGTIIDSEHLWQEAARSLILAKKKKYTKEIHREITQSLRGLSMEPSLTRLKELAQLDESLQVLAEEKLKRVSLLFYTHLDFIPGFIEFHAELQRRGVKMAVATNSNDKTVAAAIACLDLHRYFGEHIYNIGKVGGVGKPHPKIYLHAAEALGVPPECCVAIEDSSVGIESALKAGMKVLGLNTAKNREKLAKAHEIYENYSEIPISSYFSAQP